MRKRTKTLWSEEEVAFLEDKAGVYTIQCIADEINRTPSAVRSKLNRMGYSSIRELNGSMSLLQLAKAVGVSRSVVERWIEEEDLPAKRRNYYFYKSNKMHYSIYPDEFWDWAEEHKSEINFAKIKRYAILPEPSWFAEERGQDLLLPENANRNWTPDEDKKLLSLVQKGKPYKVIAKNFGRSIRAVQTRMNRLRAD